MPVHHDLFLSYRRLDKDRVAPLLVALRKRHVKVWQDEREIVGFSSIQESINENLTRARALLIWYSKDYNASQACQWELTSAYIAAKAGGENPGRRLLVVNPEPGSGHIHLPELCDQLHGGAPAPGDDAAVALLAQSIRDALNEVPASPLGDLHALTPPQWYSYTATGSIRFVGRMPEMWRLHRTLQADRAPMLTEGWRPGLVQVCGTGGMGKSLLAEEYALRFGAAYPGGVFWLRAFGYSDSDREMSAKDRAERRDSQIFDIAVQLGVATSGLSRQAVMRGLRTYFETHQRNFLWVVDDLPPVERPEEDFSPWLAPHSLGRTLITTRSNLIDYAASIELPQLDVEDALRLLVPNVKELSRADEASARAICAELGCHALAVDVTTALVKRRGYAEVLINLRDPDRDALELAASLRGILPNGHERSIAATLLSSLRELDECARDLLRLASVLAVAPIPRELQWRSLGLADALDDKDARDIADLAAVRLLGCSLAEEAGGGAISVHTLVVRTILRHDFGSSNKRHERTNEILVAAVRSLCQKLFDSPDIRRHPDMTEWVPHAQAASEKLHDMLSGDLCGHLGTYHRVRGEYSLAMQAYVRQRDKYLSCGEREDVLKDVLHADNSIGLVLWRQNRLTEARSLFEEVLENTEILMGDDHHETIISMANLALVHGSLGDLSEAARLQEIVCEWMERHRDEKDPERLAAMSNCAKTLSDLNDPRAGFLHAKILKLRILSLGIDHLSTLTSMSNLAMECCRRGDFLVAIKSQRYVLRMRRKKLGDKHLDTLQILGNVMFSLLSLRRLSTARRLGKILLCLSREELGERHEGTTQAAWAFFLVLEASKMHADAKQFRSNHLDWLLNQPQETLSFHQQSVVSMLRQHMSPSHDLPPIG